MPCGLLRVSRLHIYTNNLCPCDTEFQTAGWRLHTWLKKAFQTCNEKHFFFTEKNTIRNQFFCKIFLFEKRFLFEKLSYENKFVFGKKLKNFF